MWKNPPERITPLVWTCLNYIYKLLYKYILNNSLQLFSWHGLSGSVSGATAMVEAAVWWRLMHLPWSSMIFHDMGSGLLLCHLVGPPGRAAVYFFLVYSVHFFLLLGWGGGRGVRALRTFDSIDCSLETTLQLARSLDPTFQLAHLISNTTLLTWWHASTWATRFSRIRVTSSTAELHDSL